MLLTKEKRLRRQRRTEKRGLDSRNRKKRNAYLKRTWRPEKPKVKKHTPKPEIKVKVIKGNIFKRLLKWIYYYVFGKKTK